MLKNKLKALTVGGMAAIVGFAFNAVALCAPVDAGAPKDASFSAEKAGVQRAKQTLAKLIRRAIPGSDIEIGDSDHSFKEIFEVALSSETTAALKDHGAVIYYQELQNELQSLMDALRRDPENNSEKFQKSLAYLGACNGWLVTNIDRKEHIRILHDAVAHSPVELVAVDTQTSDDYSYFSRYLTANGLDAKTTLRTRNVMKALILLKTGTLQIAKTTDFASKDLDDLLIEYDKRKDVERNSEDYNINDPSDRLQTLFENADIYCRLMNDKNRHERIKPYMQLGPVSGHFGDNHYNGYEGSLGKLAEQDGRVYVHIRLVPTFNINRYEYDPDGNMLTVVTRDYPCNADACVDVSTGDFMYSKLGRAFFVTTPEDRGEVQEKKSRVKSGLARKSTKPNARSAKRARSFFPSPGK